MSLSTHKVEIVPVSLEPHPNADSLSIVRVYGYQVVVRTCDWKGVTVGAYLPPDSLVDTARPEFAFLKTEGRCKERIKAKKLRSVVSFGLLVPAPSGYAVGDDVASVLGVEHYEPPVNSLSSGGEAVSVPGPLSHLSKYDIDSLRRYASVFNAGERVLLTEKIHGANARFCYIGNTFYCGSRTEWKKDDAKNMWWKALDNTPQLNVFCRDHQNYVVYGEVYGDVQSFRYGCKKGEVRFAAFDVYDLEQGCFVNAIETRDLLADYSVPQVPLLSVCDYDFGAVCAFAEGRSTMDGADHIREGCVVKPLIERWDQSVGRVILKVVGAGYLEKS